MLKSPASWAKNTEKGRKCPLRNTGRQQKQWTVECWYPWQQINVQSGSIAGIISTTNVHVTDDVHIRRFTHQSTWQTELKPWTFITCPSHTVCRLTPKHHTPSSHSQSALHLTHIQQQQVAQLWLTDRVTAYVPKSPLCSCHHFQWFCAGRDAVAIHQARIMWQKHYLPNAYEILATRYNQFCMGGGSLSANISQRSGRRPPTTVGVRKLQWLSFCVVSKYPQCII